MTLSGYKTLYFDYDGTLHDSLYVYAPAFRKAYRALVEHHGANDRTWSDDEIKPFLGQTPSEMWASFGHEIGEKAKKKASELISKHMREAIKNGDAKLYSGALDTLRKLKERGYNLVFISNCMTYYMDAHAEQFGLDELFDRMVCSETYPGVERKADVLAQVRKDFEGKAAIIGDRWHDMEAGRENGLTTVAATYGFGNDEELGQADYAIESPKDLLKLFE
ncbi:MAG: HAD family hydrolase [Bacillota bacterium]